MRNAPLYFLSSVCLVALACGGDDENGGVPTADFTVTIENAGPTRVALSAGVFDTPVGADAPGPLLANGEAYEFTVTAPPGARLGLVSMFVPSNDYFIAPGSDGVQLFLEPTGQPVNGNVTSQFEVYDAGTEEDQPLGEGDNQANPGSSPGQGAPNIGPRDDDDTVRLAEASNLPQVDDFLRVTVTPSQSMPGQITEFTVRVENRSTPDTLELMGGGTRGVGLTPGLWVVHGADQTPLFTVGEPDRGQGLESLAEDGNPAGLSAQLASRLGPQVALSPGVFAVFAGDNPLPGVGDMASMGLEALAEDGMVDALAMEVAAGAVQTSGTFTTPASGTSAGPIEPGQRYEIAFRASAPAALTFATMYIQSNDVYLAPGASGIPLFQGEMPVSGEVSDQVDLYDAGTEVNERPGFGPNQAPRQSDPGEGMDEGGTVRSLTNVMDGFEYQSASETIRVSITSTPL